MERATFSDVHPRGNRSRNMLTVRRKKRGEERGVSFRLPEKRGTCNFHSFKYGGAGDRLSGRKEEGISCRGAGQGGKGRGGEERDLLYFQQGKVLKGAVYGRKEGRGKGERKGELAAGGKKKKRGEEARVLLHIT